MASSPASGACAKLPVPVIPTPPSEFTIPLPPPPAIPTLVLPCCNIPVPPFPIVIPAISISLVLNPAIVATLMGYIQAFQAFLDQFEIGCPLQ